MAGRIRSIKPEWLEDEISLISSDARVLSVALILMADDLGNGRAHPVLLATRVFPALDDRSRVLASALEELTRLRYVVLYESGGQQYYNLPNWKRHQRIDRPSPGKVPAPSPEQLAAPQETVDSTSDREGSQNPRELIDDRSEKTRASRASIPFPSYPDPEGGAGGNRDPDGLGLLMVGKAGRPDVQQVHDAWKRAVGKPNHRFRGPSDLDATTIAEAIDLYGLDSCLSVANAAPRDGMVSGKSDDKRQKHDTIRYIFGNNDSFNRILEAANRPTGELGLKPRSAFDIVKEAKSL